MDPVHTQRDYDNDPGRYQRGMRVTAEHADPAANLYSRIVRLLLDAGARRVLDVGCGDGALACAAVDSALHVVSLDAATAMVRAAAAHGPTVRADATALPVRDGAVDAVVCVNVLDHLPKPGIALRQARRVLRPGGRFVAGTISRTDSPELAPFWLPTRTTFDTEDAPALVEEVFGSVEVEHWDAQLITLPDRDSLRDYLLARFVVSEEAERSADRLAARGPLPLPVTK